MIRFAREGDLQPMLEIYSYYVLHTTYSFEYTVPTMAEFTQRFLGITAQFPWLVWEENGSVVGYAYGSAPFDRAAYQWCAELSIYLRSDVHGRGIGRKLYACAEEILKKQGYRRVYVIITGENLDSMAFHRAVGYRTVAEFPDCGIKFGNVLGTVWMEKVLNSGELPTNAPASWRTIVNCDRKDGKVLDNLSLS